MENEETYVGTLVEYGHVDQLGNKTTKSIGMILGFDGNRVEVYWIFDRSDPNMVRSGTGIMRKVFFFENYVENMVQGGAYWNILKC